MNSRQLCNWRLSHYNLEFISGHRPLASRTLESATSKADLQINASKTNAMELIYSYLDPQ